MPNMSKQEKEEKKELERRDFVFDVLAEEDEDEGSIITGRPVVYDSRTDLGYYDEIIERGALDRTDLTDVRLLVNHDLSKIPLARSRRNNGNSTMQLTVDNNGLGIRAKLDTENNAEAKALYSAVQRGDITGMSFMFSIDGEEWEGLETEHPLRRVKSIGSIVEVSAVIFPAYDATSIDARSKEALDRARSALENARQLNGAPVETGHELELEKAKFNFRNKF